MIDPINPTSHQGFGGHVGGMGAMPSPTGKPAKFSLDTTSDPSGPTTSGTKPGSLPMPLSQATDAFLKTGCKDTSFTSGGVKYSFTTTADNSGIPSGQGYTSSAQGFWVSISTSGTSTVTSGSGNKSKDWSQNYPNEYYVVGQPGGNGCYIEYSVYNQQMQPQDSMSVHYQVYIPDNMAEFAQEDPQGYQDFMQQLDKTIMKITDSMLSQLKQNFKKEQQEDWGQGASGGGC